MSTEVTKPSVAGQKATAAEESRESERPERMNEGPAVFRALLLMILFYIACGFVAWFAWHLFRRWLGH